MKRPPLSRQSAVGRGFGLASAGMLGYMLAILDGQRVMIIKQLAALAVLARLCCKDDRRRWEDGDKLDPISFMRRYRKER